MYCSMVLRKKGQNSHNTFPCLFKCISILIFQTVVAQLIASGMAFPVSTETLLDMLRGLAELGHNLVGLR